MRRDSPRLAELEERWEREALAGLGYREALARFEALWHEARQLGVVPDPDWREDLEADLAVARAVNGLPPA